MSWTVEVSPGTGPAEAQRAARLVADHLAECARAAGLTVGAIDLGETARSASFEVEGDAPLVLGDTLGTHAVVEPSTRRGKAARKRWFVGVSLHPAPEQPAATVDRADLEVTACRARGPGGQHVNKSSTAVRVRHRPTGLVVRCDEERSQHANLARAVSRLEALLAERAANRHAEAARRRHEAHHGLERGRPVRSWRVEDGALVPA